MNPPKPEPGESLIDVRYAALNKRDDWILKGKYPGIESSVILGSDGMGYTHATGERVLINPGNKWGENERVQESDFFITGMPHAGTFAQQIAVLDSHIYPVPEYLSDIEAAALPLAGVTAFRALFSRGDLGYGEKILIAGAGGGVSSIGIKMALAAGAEVFVNSSSDEKIKKAISWGCQAGWNYKENADWAKDCLDETGGVDMVLDSAGGKTISDYIQILRPGGRLVFYGATLGPWERVQAAKIYYRQIDLRGSTMGSNTDFKKMLDFVTAHQIRPHVDRIFDLEDIHDAFSRLNDPKSFGKIVIKIPIS